MFEISSPLTPFHPPKTLGKILYRTWDGVWQILGYETPKVIHFIYGVRVHYASIKPVNLRRIYIYSYHVNFYEQFETQ